MTDTKTAQIALPEQLVSSVDLSRIIRELKALDESLRQMELRKPGAPTKLSRSSLTLEDLARLNKVVLTDKSQRAQLITLLEAFHIHAPRIHMSLATEPSAVFTKKIVIWLRKNIHPVLLLEVGLQPTLAAGCMIRTNNKMFDMSLRHGFTKNRHLLVEKINEIGKQVETKAPAAEPMSTPAQATVPTPPPTKPAQAPAAAKSTAPPAPVTKPAQPAPPVARGSMKSSPVQPPPPTRLRLPTDPPATPPQESK